MKKTTLLVIVMIAALVCTACVTGGNSNGGGLMGQGVYDHADQYQTGSTFTYQAADVDRVVIDWICSRVTVTPCTEAALTVSETGNGLPAEQQMHWLLDGRTLYIRFWASGYHAVVNGEQKNLTVQVPDGIELSVSVNSAQVTLGDHTLTGLSLGSTSGSFTAGRLVSPAASVSTVSGDVRIASLEMETRAEFSSTSGSMNVGTLVCGEAATFGTVSGAVQLQKVSVPSLSLESTSGNREIGLVSCGSLSIGTVSGSSAVHLGKDLGATVTAATVSGTVKIVPAHTDTEDGVVIGDGACTIFASSTSGSFTLDQLQD